MSLSIVIPTLPRKDSGFDYILHTLEENKDFFQSEYIQNIFIYCDDKYLSTFTKYINEYNIIHIPKIKHINNPFKEGTYDYWMVNLSFDFCYAIKEASKLTNATQIMWLEDDTIIDKIIIQELEKKKNIPLLRNGLGTTCIVVKSTHINKIIDFIMIDILKLPLDWNLGSKSGIVVMDTKASYHIGEISSRVDRRMIRTVEKI